MYPRNPNRTPDDANALGVPYARSRNDVSPDIYEAMRQTKPWATLLGVTTLVCVGLSVIAAAGVLVAGRFTSSSVVNSVLSLLLGFFYLFPALFLWRYGKSIGTFLSAPNQIALGVALRQQKSYWRFMGICMLVALAVCAVGLIVLTILLVTGPPR